MNENSKIELFSEKNKARIKKHPFITGFVVIIVIIFLINTFGGSSSNTPVQPTPQKEEITPASKATAQKELDDFMEKAKKAKLVTSYEFSDRANEVFVDSVWYTQTVQNKKDFIGYIGLQKKKITGFSHFEVKDAYSNEKVGEITAFSQTIEVYK